MSEVIMTGWSPAGWREYGERCHQSFAENWPEGVGYFAYVEEIVGLRRGEARLLDQCQGCLEFIARHRDNPEARGRGALDSKRGRFRYKPAADGGLGYSYAFDAVRFCRQAFIPEAAAAGIEDGTVLAWLDADVLTTKPVPLGFMAEIIEGYDVAHIGRDHQASELGFWAVRLSPVTRGMLSRFASIYRTDQVFRLPEWHSGFVFDFVLAEAVRAGARVRDLTPKRGIRHGHVWFQTPLGRYTDHLKGVRRKQIGQSPERPAA